MDSCALCATDLGPVIHEGRHWRLILNRNQNLLGKCFLVLRRHAEDVTELRSDEWHELQGLLGTTKNMLHRVFQPDHFNYVFLQNQDRHVHLHIIPRYAAPRHFAGSDFHDTGWPGHYNISGTARRLTQHECQELQELMRCSVGVLDADECGQSANVDCGTRPA